MELHKLCQTKSLKTIEHYIKNNGIKPDKKCLHNACNIKNNYKIIKYLLTQGCSMDQDTIVALIKSNCTQDFEEIVTQYLNGLNKKIEVLEKKTRNTYDQETTTEEGSDADLYDKELYEKDYTYSTKYAIDLDVNIKQKLIDVDDFDEDIEEFLSTMDKYKIIEIDDIKLYNVPKLKKVKREIPKKYKDYFQLSDTEFDKMSFNDIKRDLISIIKKEGWHEKNNMTLINLPKDLRKLLGIEDDGYIRFSDIDVLVGLFYN